MSGGYETLTLGDGSDGLYLASNGSDFIDGGAGDDQLQGHGGDDYLIGGLGSDTYRIGASSGQDRINNYPAREVDRIEAGGSVLLSRQVDQLVMAMASYDARSGAGSLIPQDVRESLQPVLAESWQPVA